MRRHFVFRFFLILCFPRQFRREFGPDMLQLYRERYRALRPAGGLPFFRFLMRAFGDLVAHGLAERSQGVLRIVRRSGRPQPHSPGRRQGVDRRTSSIGVFVEGVWQDFRFAFRSLRRNPGVIAVAVASLALGIGATTTVFSGIDVFLLRPLPMPDADRLYNLYTTSEERGWTSASMSWGDFNDYRAQLEGVDVAAWQFHGYSLSGGDRPERVSGRNVSWNFFDVVGTQPVIGRAFAENEELNGEHRVVVVSDGLWKQRLAADPDIVGRTVTLDGESYTVIGVLPPRFWFLSTEVDVFTPLVRRPDESRLNRSYGGFARLATGVSPEQASAELDRVAAQLAAAYPEANEGHGARLAPLRWEVFDEGFRQGSAIASVAVAFLLLIACANVANLFLTRAASREREIAVRGALGASRARVLRQLLSESLVVAALGGLLGLLLAVAGVKGMVSIMPPGFPRADAIAINGRVLAFTAGISVITGLLFGLAPAGHGSQLRLTESLKEGGRTNTGSRGNRTRKALVVTEVSLALVLLVSSALLVQAFFNLTRSDLGFDKTNLLTFRVSLERQAYPDSQAIVQLQRTFLSEVPALPGVIGASGTSTLPTHGNAGTYYGVPGQHTEGEGDRPRVVAYRRVFPGFFRVMGIPMVDGRGITADDTFDRPPVVVVNETMARQHWPDGRALGQYITLSGSRREIVGISRDARLQDPDADAESMIFLPAWDRGVAGMSFIVRTTRDPTGIADAVRGVMASLDSNTPVYNVSSMEDLLRIAIDEDAVLAKVMGVMALVALLLSVMGVYGVMAHGVAQRTHEIGIRMTLGATRRDVVRMMVRQGGRLALVGIGVGLAVALVVTRSLSFFLYGVNPFDVTTFTLVTGTLLGSCVLASYLPARRATTVDPVSALRAE